MTAQTSTSRLTTSRIRPAQLAALVGAGLLACVSGFVPTLVALTI